MAKNKDKLYREILVLLKGVIEDRRVRRSIRRITELIYESKVENRRAIFERLIEIIGKLFYDKKVQIGKSSITALAFSLAKHGLANQDLLFLDVVRKNKNKDNQSGYWKTTQRLLAAYFRYFGSDFEISCKFLEICLQDHTKQMEKVCLISDTDANEYWQNNNSRLFGLSIMAMRCPVGNQYPQKLWLINLIKAGQQGDNKAKELLWSIITLVGQISDKLSIIKQSIFEELVINQDGGESEYQAMLNSFDRHFIILPDQLTGWFENFINQHNQLGQKLGQQGEMFKKWFFEHRNNLAEIFDRKCLEIINKPKYGLRPFGFDSIMIKVSPLYNVGVRSISFYPEGECFPNVKIGLTVLKIGWVNCQFWAYFRDFSLLINEGVISPIHGEQDFDYQKAVFEYILVDALHRIIVGQPKIDLDNNKIDRQKYHNSSMPKKQVIVRPFLRRLPYGHRASEMARDLAKLQMGWALPDQGITFVKTHDRWQGLPKGKPTPLFEYTDQTIIASLEQAKIDH